MDLNKLGLHIHEIRNQFTYVEIGVGLFNQSLEKGSVPGVFYALQSIFQSASFFSLNSANPFAFNTREKIPIPSSVLN